jgi:purine-nucleoside phosphorylase
MSRSLNTARTHIVGPVPARLRPTAPIAPDAVLVGDPGRALLLAQALLEEPKMCNHARGLWGYSGRTPDGSELTIQSTGMGGPSAAIVLTDLVELGVRRAVRVGTCAALDSDLELGEALTVAAAHAEGGTAGSYGIGPGEASRPDPALTAALERALAPAARTAEIASFDLLPTGPGPSGGPLAADLQTATVMACGAFLGIAVAAVLIVAETAAGETISDDALAEETIRTGNAVSSVLSG